MFYLDGNCFGSSKELRKYLNWIYPNFKTDKFNSVVSNIECGAVPKSGIEEYIRTTLNLGSARSTYSNSSKKSSEDLLSGYIVYNGMKFDSFKMFKQYITLFGISKSKAMQVWNDIVPLREWEQQYKLKELLDECELIRRLRENSTQDNTQSSISESFKQQLTKAKNNTENASGKVRIGNNKMVDCVKFQGRLYGVERLYKLLGGNNINSLNYTMFFKEVKKAYKELGESVEFNELVDSLKPKIIYDEIVLESEGVVVSNKEELQLFLKELYDIEVSLKQINNWLSTALHIGYTERISSLENYMPIWLKSNKNRLSKGDRRSFKAKDIIIDDCVFHTYIDATRYMCEKYMMDSVSEKDIKNIQNNLSHKGIWDIDDYDDFLDAINNYFKEKAGGI